MSTPLTADEDVVFREFLRLDVEPNQIPPELFAGFMKRLAESVNLPLPRARIATQGLIDKGVFDVMVEDHEERTHHEREMIRDLLLHDPEIQELLKKIVADICAKKT